MLKSRRPQKKLSPWSKTRRLSLNKTQASIKESIEKGGRNEKRFDEALQILIQQDEIFSFYPTEPEGELDLQGVDRLVFTSSSRAILFQVKSSEKGRETHYTAYGARIRCVVVDPFITPEALADRIKDEIEEVILEELADVFRCATGRGSVL